MTLEIELPTEEGTIKVQSRVGRRERDIIRVNTTRKANIPL